ncbi:hypothetical protein E3N88_43121 [Mikania micrantha]|uniref:BED-type domain-containing protein n=1 Tax=Mikania micrantha TaxID=192012 RepID=A0A5N6LFT1_9ASTR|nr:hypothetical protein E3N88_43121 [Mikania micrantha]
MDTTPESNALVSIEIQPEYFDKQMNDVDTKPTKHRKGKSIVWEYFTVENVSAGIRRACCKQCNQSFAYSMGSKVAGTSHLKRHITKGRCKVDLHNQGHLDPSTPETGPVNRTPKRRRRYRSPTVSYPLFDPDMCRQEMARMIILHDYPLHLVEHIGFKAFVHNLQPSFNMVNFNTVQGDCVATYLKEKQMIHKLIEGMPGRVCLTLDIWNSHHTTGYIFVTGQFIDSDWKIHKKLLNVVMEPYPESDSAFSHAVSACLSDWNLEGKVFSLTINQSLSEIGLNSLRGLLSEKNPSILNGSTKSSSRNGQKVRDTVKYVKTSESVEEKFLALKQQLQVLSAKTLLLDDQTRWNTTYEMLLAASELKEVFSCLDTLEPDYSGSPSVEEWKLVENLCTHLKLLLNTASLLTSSVVPTANMFFHEAWKLQLELTRASTSEDREINTLTKPMLESFDKYWKNSCLILAIAVVMDPRFKMKLVDFSFTKIYGDEAATYIKIVDEGVHELFLEYVALPVPLTPAFVEQVNGESGDQKVEDGSGGLSNGLRLGLTDFDVYIMESTSQQSKSELDQYLEDAEQRNM